MVIIKNFMGVFMVMLLVACAVISGVTIYQKYPEMDITDFHILNGDLANKITSEFEDKLVIKDHAVGLWGAINYGAFNTGNKKVIIGDNGWLFSEEEFLNYPDADLEIEKKLNIIRATRDYLSSKNVQFIVALIPSKARIYKDELGRFKLPNDANKLYKSFLQKLIQNNITAPDIASLFEREKNKGTQIFLKQDTHWTPMGAALTANMIASYTDQIDMPRTEFETILKSKDTYDADLKKYIQTGYFKKWIGLKDEKYTPHNTISNSDSGGLFDDPVLPVTLVGTSYSAIQKWNFEGALKTALQADVLNVAMEGKGPMQPMAEYLSSADFENTKLVVWEIPERFVVKPYDDVTFPDFITKGMR